MTEPFRSKTIGAECVHCRTWREGPLPPQWVCRVCRWTNWNGVYGDIAKVMCIDFDGVVHRYSRGWQDGRIYDPPVEGAIEAMMALQERGFWLIVSTVRDDLEAVDEWLAEQWLAVVEKKNPEMKLSEVQKRWPVPEVTNYKPGAIVYIDDNAWRFDKAKGKKAWEEVLHAFVRVNPAASQRVGRT